MRTGRARLWRPSCRGQGWFPTAAGRTSLRTGRRWTVGLTDVDVDVKVAGFDFFDGVEGLRARSVRGDVAEHLHCDSGFVEVGEGVFRLPFEGFGDQKGAFAQNVAAGLEPLGGLRGSEVAVDINPPWGHDWDQWWRLLMNCWEHRTFPR
jgi:hypothetical protein